VLLAAVVVVAAGQWWLAAQRAQQEQEANVREAAGLAVERVLSYDYRRLEAGAASTRPLLTAHLQKQYASLQEQLQRTAPRLQASITAVVRQSAVLDADDSSAKVLLFVNQTTVSRKLTGPQLDQSRVIATLVQHDGDWLVDSVRAV
jgi:Mce-associated membrane protein